MEDLSRSMTKKLTQNKAMIAAKADEEKDNKTQNQSATSGLRSPNKILPMAQPLQSKSPSFMGDLKINLSWKEVTKPSAPPAAAAAAGFVNGSQKRTAAAVNGSSANTLKKGQGVGGMQNQLLNKAFEDLSAGGRGRRNKGWWERRRGRVYC